MNDSPDWYVTACLIVAAILTCAILGLMAWSVQP